MSEELVVPKIFAKDFSNLLTLVAWAVDMQRVGSYYDRHPNLGKMRRCPYCGKRRREFGQRCCNAAYTKTMKVRTPEGIVEKEVPERVTAAIISKSVIKRILKKKHGQNRRWAIKHQTFLLQNSESLLKSAAEEMHVKVPEVAAIPSFAEKYWLWKQERQDRKVRRQQRKSRAINAHR